jgi:two-component system, response regulator, stage 0 sporulation protein F
MPILISDDESDIRHMISELLKDEGYISISITSLYWCSSSVGARHPTNGRREGGLMITLGTILVVEADTAIADVLVAVLTDEGYSVQTVASGSEALTALQAEPPDLALIDLSLPDMRGWKLLESMRAQSIDVPIVVMTVSSLAAEELAAAGVQACLSMPFDLDDLLHCVTQHIQHLQSLSDAKRSMSIKPAIILVDEESFVLTLLERILAGLASDYDLLSVVNGAAALALIAQRPVALVITDQHMPDMDGAALTAAIKAAAPLCPVILMSGNLDLQQRAEAAGVDFFLPKPFGFDQLETIVRAAIVTK